MIRKLVDLFKGIFKDKDPIDPPEFEIQRLEEPVDKTHVEIEIYNDDQTTMDFVIKILLGYFSLDKKRAVKIMLKIHKEGSARVGWFSTSVSDQIIAGVLKEAEKRGYPLRLKVVNT
jgi:ATP-dependent Clp protease adaptor protein ClpS